MPFVGTLSPAIRKRGEAVAATSCPDPISDLEATFSMPLTIAEGCVEMLSNPEKNSHNSSEDVMTVHTADSTKREIRQAIEVAAGPRAAGETKERWLERAGYALGLSYSRVLEMWHLRARRIDAHELLNVRERLKSHATMRISKLREEISRLEVAIAQEDRPGMETSGRGVLAGREE